MSEGKNLLEEIAEACGGKIDWVAELPDGSGAATMSMPLPKTHWIYQGDRVESYGVFNTPPMPFLMGAKDKAIIMIGEPDEGEDADAGLPGKKGAKGLTLTKYGFADLIQKAGRYAVRCATMNGKETDFDPDALVQNLVIGFLGYFTESGLSSDKWANPGE